MRIRSVASGLALLLCTATPALAQLRDAAADVPAAVAAADHEAAIIAEQSALATARAGYLASFEAAYARYPAVPRGLLESIAYVQSRWSMLDGARVADAESAPAVGVMGLYQGDGFADQVGDAAALLGVPRSRVESDAYWNILGAAALLSDTARRLAPDASEADLLAACAGFQTPDGDAIADFARESFAYDVLLALDRGADDNGIRIDARAIEWEH